MLLDVIDSVLQIPVAFGQIGLEQMFHQTLRIPKKKNSWQFLLIISAGEFDLAFQDLLVDEHGVLVGEGVDASQHLVQKNAKSPPIYGFAVTLVQQHFRRQILRRAAEGVGAPFALLREAEISQLEVAPLVDENVLWLEVAVDDILAVEVFKHADDLRSVEPRNSMTSLLRLRHFKRPDRAQISEELAASHELQHEIQITLVLRHAFHRCLGLDRNCFGGGTGHPDLCRARLGSPAFTPLQRQGVPLTMKGCAIEERMVFSFIMWSTCLRRMISAFLRIFTA